MTAPLLLYHTGFSEIRRPDVAFGRKNADFGRGFYLSDDPEFARRWAKRRRGADTVLNVYELDSAGLTFLRLDRDETWFDYIARNRAGGEDRLRGADVIVGPIANDTLYDTMGLFTSGLLDRAQALFLLLQGPLYRQTVLKTDRAAASLRWLSARVLDAGEIDRCRALVREEEEAYQALCARALADRPG